MPIFCSVKTRRRWNSNIGSSMGCKPSRRFCHCRAGTQHRKRPSSWIAARRVAAFGRVHRRLHLLDHQKNVEFKQYLRLLGDDLSGLLFPHENADRPIVVGGAAIEIPTATAIPLGFIANELITMEQNTRRATLPLASGHRPPATRYRFWAKGPDCRQD
jgi:hypothetical protein